MPDADDMLRTMSDLKLALDTLQHEQLSHIRNSLTHINQELHAMSETAQQHADALTAKVAAMDTALKAGVAAIIAEIEALKAQTGTTVDFGALDAAVTTLEDDVKAAAAIPPAPPAA